MRRAIMIVGGLAAAGLAVAGGVVGLGLYNVSAQAGHLPGVSWVLHTTFRSSVKLRAPDESEAPPLDDPDLIALGAGHYATACVMCHGTPGDGQTAVARAMVPMPPPIDDAIENWGPGELHWIIENGVKMSGMPGWPVEDRGGEVWSVVAYLEATRQDRAPEIPTSFASDVAYCQSCHDKIGGPVPRLDLQTADYLETQLHAYLAGLKPSGIMAQAASVVPPERLDDLARVLSGGAGAPPREGPDADAGQGEGAALAARGTRDVPACLACHGEGPQATGPRLVGQPEPFLSAQLTLWRDGVYDHDRLMAMAARDLTDEDIAVLSRYFAATSD